MSSGENNGSGIPPDQGDDSPAPPDAGQWNRVIGNDPTRARHDQEESPDLFSELDEAKGDSFQDQIPTAYDSKAFELGEPPEDDAAPSYTDNISTVSYDQAGVGFEDLIPTAYADRDDTDQVARTEEPDRAQRTEEPDRAQRTEETARVPHEAETARAPYSDKTVRALHLKKKVRAPRAGEKTARAHYSDKTSRVSRSEEEAEEPQTDIEDAPKGLGEARTHPSVELPKWSEEALDEPPTSPSKVAPESSTRAEQESSITDELDSEPVGTTETGEISKTQRHDVTVPKAYIPPAPSTSQHKVLEKPVSAVESTTPNAKVPREEAPSAPSESSPNSEDLLDLSREGQGLVHDDDETFAVKRPNFKAEDAVDTSRLDVDDTIQPEDEVPSVLGSTTERHETSTELATGESSVDESYEELSEELIEEKTFAGPRPEMGLDDAATSIEMYGVDDTKVGEAEEEPDTDGGPGRAGELYEGPQIENEPDTDMRPRPKFIDAPTLESVTFAAAEVDGEASLDDAAPLKVVAPSFESDLELIHDEDSSFAEKLSTQISKQLRTQVTSASMAGGGSGALEVVPEHRDVDPRPFLESLRRNPRDRAALEALRRIYAAGDRFDELIELLLEHTEYVDTPEDRLPLLCEVARIFVEHLGAHDKAQIALISAILLDPGDEAVAAQLAEVSTQGGLWGQLFAELGEAVAQEAQAGRRAMLCARLGDWYLEAGHLEYAQPCYQQALLADLRSLRAMSGMALIFEKTGDAANFDQALAHIPPAVPPESPADLYLRVAGLYERRGSDKAAAITLEQALNDHPQDERFVEAFEKVLGRQERWPELTKRLVLRAEELQARGDDIEGAASLWRRAALLLGVKVGDMRGTERACRAVIDLAGPDVKCLEVLSQIYSGDGRWAELVWVLEQLVEETSNSKERGRLLSWLAQVESDELVRLDAAESHLRQLLELEPRNMDAHRGLIELLRQGQRWSDLTAALESLAVAERDDEARAQCLMEAARVRTAELAQPQEAVELIKRAQKLSPRDPTILGALAETLVASGDAAQGFESLKQQAELTEDPRARAAILLRAADLAKERLFDKQGALELLEKAVVLDPSLREAASQLRDQRIADGDWEGAAQALEGEIANAAGSGQRGRLLLQLAEMLRDRLHRELDALDAFEQARAALGDVREVIAPLYELYDTHERLEEAVELSKLLAKIIPKDDPDALARQTMRFAEVSLKADDKGTALKHLEAALEASPNHTQALRQVADLYEEQQRWDDARKALSTVAKIESGIAPNLTIRARLGRLSRLADRHEDARRWFEEVLDEQPNHNEALRQLAAIAEARGEPARALELLERAKVEGDDARFNHWTRLADLAQKAKDQSRYEQALRSALEVRHDDHRVLTRLLEVLSQNETWPEAIELILKLADTVKGNNKARAKYFSAAAKIYRDKLGDIHGATEMYEKELDEDWTNLAEFASLDKMLTQAREYQLQERVYRKMLKRVSGKNRPELEAQLWHSLGEIYRSRLQRYTEAAEAFTVASRFEPDNAERHIILAELHQALKQPNEVLARHQELLRLQPGRLESLKAMREICSATGLYDRAFAIVSNLVARGQATQPEQEFFEQWIPRAIINATAPLGDEDWLRHLRHPDEDPYISGIFDTILSLVLKSKARQTKEFGLSDETLVDFNKQAGSVLAQQFLAVVRVLGLPVAPQLHIVRQQPTLMAYAVTNPISSIMGGAITQVSEPQRIFIMARHLAYYQGGRYMAMLCPTKSELGSIMASAVAAVTGQDQAVPPTAKKFLANLKSSLKKNPTLFERLGQVVQRFMARGGTGDFDKWLRGVEMTSCRAALLLVADPRVAAACFRLDTSSPASVSVQDRFEDLLNFVVTEDYLKLREALGVTVS